MALRNAPEWEKNGFVNYFFARTLSTSSSPSLQSRQEDHLLWRGRRAEEEGWRWHPATYCLHTAKRQEGRRIFPAIRMYHHSHACIFQPLRGERSSTVDSHHRVNIWGCFILLNSTNREKYCSSKCARTAGKSHFEFSSAGETWMKYEIKERKHVWPYNCYSLWDVQSFSRFFTTNRARISASGLTI